MSSKHHCCKTADEEINSPELFLPTSLRFSGTNTFWVKQSYALFSGTQTPKEVPSNWRSIEPKETHLPPKMQILKQQKHHPEHIASYIEEFQSALQMVHAWYKSQPPNETMESQIESWIRTCDLLTENQHFTEQQHWRVPTFQPWYHLDTYLCLQQYFYIKRRITNPSELTALDKQEKSAQRMFDTWEEACFRVFQRNFTPIPKCLWYYKIKYVQRNESQKWKCFFHDIPFQVWGLTEEETESTNRRGNATTERPTTNPPFPARTLDSHPAPKPPNSTKPNKPSNKHRNKKQN
jgi:hypothetical protein